MALTYSFNASGFTANNLYTGLGPTFLPASVRDLIPNQVNAIPLITPGRRPQIL